MEIKLSDLWGLFKKMVIADRIAAIPATIFSASFEDYTGSHIFFAVLCYSFQIYGDFSGGTDITRGAAQMMGINLPMNFERPFFATSMADFWRRWHMSLGSWFRDYVYIPLGGNRKGTLRHIINIFVVWGLTGIWHGAGWTFMSWGLYFGVLLLLEKFVYGKALKKMPSFVQHFYVLFMVLLSWVLFNASTFTEAWNDLKNMFGMAGLPLISADTLYNLSSYLVVILVGLFASTPITRNIARKYEKTKVAAVLEPVFVAVVLIVTTAYLVDGSFSPFLYFRF